jgi:inosine-uridine nucleoside N-ribohydrolase
MARSAGLAAEPGLTFFGWSDQHVATDGNGSHLEPAIDAMNALPGRDYPPSIGGKVEPPAFVLGCGDITEWPTVAAKDTYEKLVTERLEFSVYDLAGNHDDGGKVPSPTVLNWIRSRHGSLTYTFEERGVHFVALHSEFDPDGTPHQPIAKEALAELRRLLARIPAGEPVVVATHLCYDAITNRDEFVAAFGDARVILVLGGHYHKATVHTYRGYPFVQLPSPEPRSPSEITVLRITSDRVLAIPYDYDRGEWVEDPKKILNAELPASSRQRRILLDTDPGGDDIFCLLWLESLARQGLAEIVAVTTVAGNVTSEQTFANASRVLALGGFEEVEVGRAAPGPEGSVDAAHIHGPDGMGNLSESLGAPVHEVTEARASPDIIIEKLEASPGEITLVAVGPLTNLAAAESQSPGILEKAREIVIMGGAFRRKGNVTPVAEFNIGFDPEAAERVFSSRDDIVVLPLDVTEQVTFTLERARTVHQAAPDSRLGGFIADLCGFLSTTSLGYKAVEGVRGFHVHDATTLAYLLYPETLMLRRARVRIETQGQWTRGQTLFDDRHTPKTEANAWVALEVDAVNLLAILSQDLEVLARSR